ncbi:hypothetical protein Emtol_0171 (plasmid) [Emticicia oligotrophica DSM 17448]|uniref:YWFCY domain-containing protein n=1 Tax=Emticicia oligotrophica (strain DSM 17448 / CIP 109782 / MTCC 6937 / GPTSA100-15) TaxID=929562 RepID=A0ABM5N7N1_EMTOG|nr:YWFCY domain-containing protein [Emticicia oligotrophica]AFK05443.1 hypothetical protein Emtol_0171 [Emticicia oligotrophica DSM 17448]
MYTQTERDGLQKILEIMLYASITALFFNIYVYCFTFFEHIPIVTKYILKFLSKVNQTTSLFQHHLTSKILSFFLLFFYIAGSRGVKSKDIDRKKSLNNLLIGVILFFSINIIFAIPFYATYLSEICYSICSVLGYFLMIKGGQNLRRLINFNIKDDIFNTASETFPQNIVRLENEFSVNFESTFQYDGKVHKGEISVVNPQRAVMVIGTPGSGKSYSILLPAIRQSIAKGYTLFIYDFKFPDLTLETYGAILHNLDGYGAKRPKFYVINFDDPERSHRCNPIAPHLLLEQMDAYESARTLMCNLNRTWISKEGDFWVDSAINFVTSIIWILKMIADRKQTEYQAKQLTNPDVEPDPLLNICTLPHVIEFANRKYDEILPILVSYHETRNYAKSFYEAFTKGSYEQLDGQVSTTLNALARLSTPTLYWVMSGNDFYLDLNNQEDPKILCVGNNPERDKIYGAALGLYTSRMIKTINKKGRQKLALFLDELPTIYLGGLDKLIATARSNKIATWMGIQDFSQLKRDYGDKEATVIINSVGNIFSGQVTGETAEKLSKLFLKTKQIKESLTESRNDSSMQFSIQVSDTIYAAKISNLSQGTFVGQVADNFDKPIENKTFHAKIKVDTPQYSSQELPIIKDFSIFVNDEFSKNHSKESTKKYVIQQNYHQIIQEIDWLVQEEMIRIKKDFPHLIKPDKS